MSKSREKTIEKTVDLPVQSQSQPQPGQIQVFQGNVPIVTVQLLAEINMKLSKILAIMESKVG